MSSRVRLKIGRTARVFVAVSETLGLDDRFQVEDLQMHPGDFVHAAPAEEILVGEILANRSEYVQTAELGQQEMLLYAAELQLIGHDPTAGGISVDGVELAQRSGKSLVARGLGILGDIEVQGDDRGAREDSSDASDDDEVDFVKDQDLKLLEEFIG